MNKKTADKSTVTLKLKIPSEVKPLLDACATFQNVTPENYTLTALATHLRCDTEGIADDARAALAALERGQQ